MTLLLMKCRGNNELLNLDPCKLFFVIVARLAIYVPQLPQGFSLSVKIFFPPSLNESTLPDKRVCACAFSQTPSFLQRPVGPCHPLVAMLKSCIPN